MEDSVYTSQNQALPDAVGSQPEISRSTLEVKNRTINSVDQAFSVCTTLVNDWKKGILNATRITAKINGERPYNQKKLKDAGKDHKTNISTGFLATECARVVPRLYMPLKSAKYLTAACLPNNWPDGQSKSEYFRQVITETIKSWPKWNFYVRGLAREVGVYGFAFNVFLDEYDWRPSLMRVDKGFVPQGTEVMEEPAFFMAKYAYKPHELLTLLKDNVDAGRSEWNKDNTVDAIMNAVAPPVDSTYPNARVYEELIRQATWSYIYTKGERLIQTYHLFAKETSGTVSHYILLAGDNPQLLKGKTNNKKDGRLLYEFLDKYPTMRDAVGTVVFDYGDGTVHGSLGAAGILYDLAVQVEKIRCDSMDNMRMTNKMKLQVADGKNINDVKLSVNDQWMMVSSATFAGNSAGLVSDVEGYNVLDEKLSQLAQQKIGAFVPPIPLQPSDIKAAQVNAAMMKERELQEALLENWLIQIASSLISPITKRLCNFESPDNVAINCINKLKKRLTDEEITLLASEFPVQSVMDFTEFKAQQRAQFAATVQNNPLFRQDVVAKVMAGGVGDQRFVDEICVPEGDQSVQLAAQRQQKLENAALAIGQDVEVLPQDMDWIHMETLKPQLEKVLQSENADLAELGLRHYAAHYAQGVDKKGIPEESINPEKSWIASAEKHIQAIRESQAIRQQAQQAQQAAEEQAQAIIQQESLALQQ